MEKKKLPKWVFEVLDFIPLLVLMWAAFVNLFGFAQGGIVDGVDFSIPFRDAADCFLSLPDASISLAVFVSWMLFLGLYLTLQFFWLLGWAGIFKLKEFLHNRKAPR